MKFVFSVGKQHDYLSGSPCKDDTASGADQEPKNKQQARARFPALLGVTGVTHGLKRIFTRTDFRFRSYTYYGRAGTSAQPPP